MSKQLERIESSTKSENEKAKERARIEEQLNDYAKNETFFVKMIDSFKKNSHDLSDSSILRYYFHLQRLDSSWNITQERIEKIWENMNTNQNMYPNEIRTLIYDLIPLSLKKRYNRNNSSS